jgi:hypothetical protein
VCETLAAIFDKIWKHANANQNWKTELSQNGRLHLVPWPCASSAIAN